MVARELKGYSIENFLKGINSDATRETYYKKLRQFLEHIGLSPDAFLEKSRKDGKFAEHKIIDYVEKRRGEVSGSTIRQLKNALKHFFEMNDLDDGIKWAKISKLMPHAKKIGSDRAPTVEEVRRILDQADLRMKCIVLLSVSSGIRVGAFDHLTWGDVESISHEEKVMAAKLRVYNKGSGERYVTFITPECYEALLQYRERREAIGEIITSTSPLIRDLWDNHRYRKRRSQDPKKGLTLSSKAIRNEVGDLLHRIGIRDTREKRYEFKQVHGFRKFFKTNAERAMKTIDVEKLLGHAENYYKPSENYLVEEYLKAVPFLTISEAVELKNKLEQKVVISDKRVGELERENIGLQDRLDKIEKSYEELKKLVETKLISG